MDKITNIVSIGCSWVAHPYDWEEISRANARDKVNPNIKKKNAHKYSFAKYLGDKLNISHYNFGSAGASNDFIFSRLFRRINEYDLTNSFVIIGLTEPTRHNFGIRGFKYQDAQDGLWDWKKTFFTEFYDEGIRIKYIMMMLDLFYEYLKNRNSELVVFNSFSDKISYPKRNYFLNKFETWNDFITSYDNKHEKGAHPIEYDHKILANLLYEEYFNE